MGYETCPYCGKLFNAAMLFTHLSGHGAILSMPDMKTSGYRCWCGFSTYSYPVMRRHLIEPDHAVEWLMSRGTDNG